MTDREIVELFLSRSDSAVRELSEKYGRLCMKLAFNILGSERDAEECVNDAYLGVWDTIPPEEPEKLSAYVCRIVRNLSLKRYEYNSAQKRHSNYGECIEELEELIGNGNEVEETADGNLLKADINEFLRTLDRENRIIFVRRYFFDESFAGLSELTGLKEGAIRTRLSRTKEKLRVFLKEKGVIV